MSSIHIDQAGEQYYPTPRALAHRAWALFKDKDIVRLLEPSAGTGDLVAPRTEARYCHLQWDAIERNPERHARLRELGAQVVGFDFMEFASCAMYSHILMNRAGVEFRYI